MEFEKTIDLYGVPIDNDNDVHGFKRFLFHYILCYYGYEEDSTQQRKVSIFTNTVKMGALVLLLMFILLLGLDKTLEGALRAWVICEIVAQVLIAISFTLVSNRNQIKEALWATPSQAPPGRISLFRTSMLWVVIMSYACLASLWVWGIFIVSMDYNVSLWTWLCFSGVSLGIVFMGIVTWQYAKKLIL